MESLQDITKKYSILTESRGNRLDSGTDKLVVHNYPVAYDDIFSKVRETATNVVEIGVAGGWSLKVWEEYFPKANIHGIDIDKTFFHPHIADSDRIDMKFYDATDESKIHANFSDESVDIVIDDGSHLLNHQIVSAALFWPKLKEGGIYVIEDTQNLRYDKYFTMYPNYKTYDCCSAHYRSKGDVSLGEGMWKNHVSWNSTLYAFKKENWDKSSLKRLLDPKLYSRTFAPDPGGK